MPTIHDVKNRCVKNLPRYFIWLFVSALLVGADQLSKYLVVAYLPKEGNFNIIPLLFNFTYVENKGAAWGILADSRWVFIVISSVSIVAIGAVLLYVAKNRFLFVFPLVLIFAGGIGNMIDRIANGYVVDFIQFAFFQKFPVFNVADSYVTIGGVILMIYVLFVDTSFLSGKKKNDGK